MEDAQYVKPKVTLRWSLAILEKRSLNAIDAIISSA
jgi:hypothetical protein